MILFLIFLTVRGILLPFVGTLLGSAFVIFSSRRPSARLLAVLDSLAAGIMCAASFFSLILPAVERAEEDGILSRIFCPLGFFLGVILFVLINKVLDSLLSGRDLSGNMMILSVSLHNIPEGMAVGVVYAGLLSGNSVVGAAGAMALSVGIAMQNIPEGAIISLPLCARGKTRLSAFLWGCISGLAELIAGVLTLFFSQFIYSVLPFSLCFAAGAMFYVVMAELSRNFHNKKHSDMSLCFFGTGFVVMMLLDTLLG